MKMTRRKFQRHKKNIAYIGIDNGVTGAFAVHSVDYKAFFPTPVFSDVKPTKKPGNITRVQGQELLERLSPACECSYRVYILLERPLINPKFFAGTLSAMMALETTLTVFGTLDALYGNVYYRFIDSREWQAAMIPGVSGKDQLKEASTVCAIQKHPEYSMELMRKDGDAICIMDYMLERSKWLNRMPWRVPGYRKQVVLDDEKRL